MKIKSIRKIESGRVLNVCVHKNHTIISRNGIITHNCDNLNSNSAQPALRGMIESFSSNCKFIITCNYVSKIIPAIVNRFCVFNYDKLYDDMQAMVPAMYARLKFILDNEGISYGDGDIQQVLKACYPSFRDAIGTLQKSTWGNTLKVEISVQAEFESILNAMKSKNYAEIIKSVYCLANVDGFYSWLFDYENKQPSNLVNPMVYVTLAKYQYQHSFARDPKLNLVACCVEIISQNQL